MTKTSHSFLPHAEVEVYFGGKAQINDPRVTEQSTGNMYDERFLNISWDLFNKPFDMAQLIRNIPFLLFGYENKETNIPLKFP